MASRNGLNSQRTSSLKARSNPSVKPWTSTLTSWDSGTSRSEVCESLELNPEAEKSAELCHVTRGSLMHVGRLRNECQTYARNEKGQVLTMFPACF